MWCGVVECGVVGRVWCGVVDVCGLVWCGCGVGGVVWCGCGVVDVVWCGGMWCGVEIKKSDSVVKKMKIYN